MISLKTYRDYYEDVMRRVPGIHSVRVVNVDQDMSDCLKSISSDELPVLFVVVPSAQETGTDPDNVEEDNLCLIFLMDRMDMQRRGPVRVLEDTQPLVESIKNVMRGDRNRGCCLMRNLDRMTTTPETGFYTDYSGWSVSFKLGTE